jgi:ribosomal protein S12 methylthiotransferase accessory factor
MEFTVSFSGKKQVIAHMGEHNIITDQPVYAGGDNECPSPFSLFLASLGTCAGIYVKSFCDQRGIPTNDIKITQRHSFNPSTQMIENVDLVIELPESFPEKYKETVIRAADQCAVKKHLLHPPSINVSTSVMVQ